MKSSVFLEFFKIFFRPQNTVKVLINYEGPKITTDYRVGLPIMPKNGCGNQPQIRQRTALKPTAIN
jgi:hypothetical protein